MASYRVEVANSAHGEIRRLPGNVRQRVIRALRRLQQEARPIRSQALTVGNSERDVATGLELRRIRLDTWRIVYLVEESARRITVLAVRKRPPYQYEDLNELLGDR